MRYRAPKVDTFVSNVEARLAPLRGPESKDPAVRRQQAADLDLAASRELGVTPIPTATEEHALTVPGHPDVRLRVYWPDERRATPAETGGLPVLVYFYGGGFTLAGIDWVGWDAGFRERARDAGIIVVAGEYSHAPEVRFPAQPEQCWTVFEWAANHARELGGDPAKLAIGGASSGGNLAAAVTLMNRDRNKLPVRMQLLESPALDLTTGHLDPSGLDSRVPGAILRHLARRLVRQYLGRKRSTRANPYASPLLAHSLEGLPPAVIYTAELDPIRGDGEAYARRLFAAGVPVTAVRYIGQTHTSGGMQRQVPAADHLHRDIVTTLRTLHDSPIHYTDPRVTPAADQSH